MPKSDSQLQPGVQTPEELLASCPSDTIAAMVEIYEAAERAYRAAMMTGVATSRVTHSTNPS